MSGSLMDLIAFGAQDVYLTGNPQVSYFKCKFKSFTNFGIEEMYHKPKLYLDSKILKTTTEDMCPICLDNYECGNKIHMTNCGHTFHYNCLMEYIEHVIEKTYSCPCCRKNIDKQYKNYFDS